MSATDRVWYCPCCGTRQAGPFSPCPDPACIAETIREEADWKRYDDD